MIGAYLDESGSAESGPDVLMLSAVCGTPEVLNRALSEWLATVRRFGVREFHATDCANGAKEFEGWSNNRKKKMFKSLVDILTRHQGLNCHCAGILLEDYKAVVGPMDDRYFQGPRTLIFQFLTMNVAIAEREPIAFVMDRPSKGWGYIDEAFESTKRLDRPWCRKLQSLTPGTVERFPAIQMPDLVAYESRRALRLLRGHESLRAIRRSAERLFLEKKLKVHYFTKEVLISLIAENDKNGINVPNL